jgi:hypothetical protein
MEIGKDLKEKLKKIDLNLNEPDLKYLLDVSESVCDSDFAEEILKKAQTDPKFSENFKKRLEQSDEKEERFFVSLKPFEEVEQKIFVNSLKSYVEKMNNNNLQKIAFLYSHRKKDGEYKEIQKILNFPFGSKYDISSCSTDEVIDIILKSKETIFILNGHGSGTLSFRLNKDNTFNFQGGYDENFQFTVNNSFLSMLNSKLNGVKKISLLLLTCHIGQITGVNFSSDETSEITLYSISSDNTLSFKNVLNILEYIKIKGLNNGVYESIELKEKHFKYESQNSAQYLKKAMKKMQEDQNLDFENIDSDAFFDFKMLE